MRLRKHALIAAVALAATAPAHAEKRVSPYIEVGQVFEADLKNGGEVLTYTTVSAGIDAAISTRRTEIQINYNYERRFGYDDDVEVDDIHSGLAQISYQAIPELLSLDAGALAARSRVDIRGAAPQADSVSSDNTSQVYSLYAGPTLATSVGGLDVTGAYRFGYTKVEDSSVITLPAGQERLDGYDSATAHLASASIGMAPGVALPVGWQVSGAYEREDASQLDQRFEGKFARLDLTLPVTPTLAVVGGIGYEDIEISQRDAVRDAGGAPVIDEDGRFVTDESSPRQLAYDQDGLIYDAGVIWRPSARTQLEARAGWRYGGTTYFGTLTHQLTQDSGFSVVVYDGIESFGRLLNDNISRLPSHWNAGRNPLGNGFNGCVFGAAGAGGCFDDVFQSINTANFRNRGVTALYSAQRGRTSMGIGLGYAQRKYFAPRFGNAFSLDGVKDENWFGQAYLGYALTGHSGVDVSGYVDYYDSGIAGASSVSGAGLTGTYYHNFTRNLSASATGNLYTYDQEGSDAALIGAVLLAMRLQY